MATIHMQEGIIKEYGTQIFRYRIPIGIELLSKPSEHTKSVYVFLFKENEYDSSITTNQLLRNDNDERGWFIEHIDVEMYFDEDYMQLLKEEPHTQNANGSVSSSMSTSIGGNVGAFGTTPTAGVDASASWSNSNSHDMKDFTFRDNTERNHISHEYRMTQAGDGTPFSEVYNLYEFNSFSPTRVRPLPELAWHDFNLLEQAIWRTPPPPDKPIQIHEETLHFNLNIHVWVGYAYNWPNRFAPWTWGDKKTSVEHLFNDFKIPIDLSKV